VASAVADFNYAGSTTLGNTWNRPNWSSTSGVLTCTVSDPAVNVKYQTFNTNFTAPTYITILSLFEKDFISGAELFVYNATEFSPASPCTGLLLASGTASGAPPIDIPILVPVAGTYTVVITGEAAGVEGLFATNVIVAQSTGNNRNSANQWFPINSGSVSTDCTDEDSTATNFATFTWNNTVTGEYDVQLFFTNATFTGSFYPTVGVFQGLFPNHTATPGTPLSACTDGRFLWGVYGDSDGTLTVPRQTFTAGVTYTFVVSGYAPEEIGDFGLFIHPTRYGDTSTSTATFLAPSVPALGVTATCELGTTMKNWQTVVFTATQPVYIMDTGSDSSYDTAVFLYSGNYSTAPPETCAGFIYAGDTGDGGPIAVVVVPGQTYTAVVSAYSTGSGRYSLYSLTGLPLGVPSTTGGATSVATAGATGASGVVTAAGTTGVQPVATTGSDAATAAASMLLVVIAAIFAMF
jgi:hypothetical protein